MKKDDIELHVFFTTFHVVQVHGKEIKIEKNGYLDQKLCIQRVFIQNLVDIVPAARQLLGQPYNTFMLFFHFLSDKFAYMQHSITL